MVRDVNSLYAVQASSHGVAATCAPTLHTKVIASVRTDSSL